MYRDFLSHDIFSDLDRMQRLAIRAFDVSPSVRGVSSNRFPAVNISISPQTVEVYCFAPGIDPDKLEIKLEKGVLSISGERNDDVLDAEAGRTNVHIGERFAGKFHRVVRLPEDVDSSAVTASYHDGVIRITAPRREAAQPRRITIQ